MFKNKKWWEIQQVKVFKNKKWWEIQQVKMIKKRWEMQQIQNDQEQEEVGNPTS